VIVQRTATRSTDLVKSREIHGEMKHDDDEAGSKNRKSSRRTSRRYGSNNRIDPGNAGGQDPDGHSHGGRLPRTSGACEEDPVEVRQRSDGEGPGHEDPSRQNSKQAQGLRSQFLPLGPRMDFPSFVL
jgi:hypothetical protein